MANRTTKVTLSAQIQGYVDGMKEAARATRETGTEAEKLAQRRQAFQTLGQAALGLGAAITGVGVAALKTGIEYNTLQQTSRAALTSLLGDAEAANAQMDRLDDFARNSPFAKQTFIVAQQQMLAFGIEAQRVIPYLDAIQNAVAAAGGSNADIEALAEIFGKISASSKITAIDLQQFGRRGINAAELIGESMGYTGAQIREQITANTLDADAALEALATGMSTRFEGASDNVKQTFAGAMDRVKAAWRDFSAELAAPLVDPNGGGALVDLLNWAADMMRAFEALPEPVKIAIRTLGGLVGVGALIIGSIALVVPKIASYRAAIESLELSGSRLTRTMGLLGKAVAIGAVVGVVASLIRESAVETTKLANALERAADAQEVLGAAADAHSNRGWGHLYGELNKVTVSAEQVADAIIYAQETADRPWWKTTNLPGEEQLRETLRVLKLVGDEMASVAQSDVPAMQQAMRTLADEYKWTADEQWAFIENSPNLKSALEDMASGFGLSTDKADLLKIALGEVEPAAEGAASGTDSATDSAEELAKEAEEAAKRLDTMSRALADVAAEALNMGDAHDKALGALNKLADAAQDEEAALDGTNDSSIRLRDSIRDVERAHRDAADATLRNNGTLEEAMAIWNDGRDAIIEQRMAMGESREEAIRWANENLGSAQKVARELQNVKRAVDDIPSNKNINLSASGNALSMIQDVNAWLNATPNYKHISVSSSGGVYGIATNPLDRADGAIDEYSDGGIRPGLYRGGPPIVRFAEPETGWEAFISGKPSERSRNREIWVETGRRLGIEGVGQGTTINHEYSITLQASGNLHSDIGTITHELRKLSRGGKYVDSR